MPILFNPSAFKSPGFQQAAADRAPDAMEFALAKAKLEGWKEARENDKKRLALAEQDQAMQVEDRDATMQAAQGAVDYKQAQAPRDERRKGLRIGGNANDPLGLTQGASVGMAQSDEQEENAQIERIATEVTKDPRARMAFLEDVDRGRKERAIGEGLTRVRDRLQDRLVGLANDPDAAAFAPEFQRLVDELEQIDETMDPKLAAGLIDNAERKEAEYFKEVRETALWKQQQRDADVAIQAEMENYPPGHPMREWLRAAALDVRIGEVDPKNAIQAVKAAGIGLMAVTLPNGAQAWMNPKDAGDFQDKMADNTRAEAKDAAQAAATNRGLDFRERTAAENKAFREREVSVKEKNADKERGPSVGLRYPTNDSITREANDIYAAWDDEDKAGEEGFTRDDAYKIAQGRAIEHWQNAQSNMGKGGGAQSAPGSIRVEHLGDQGGDPFLDAMTPAKRAEYDALPPELQKRIREKAGGG
jgi:hypothetical protein